VDIVEIIIISHVQGSYILSKATKSLFFKPDVCVPYQYNELVEKMAYKFYFSTSFSINETGGEWNGQ
jgi:hypothetical protein